MTSCDPWTEGLAIGDKVLVRHRGRWWASSVIAVSGTHIKVLFKLEQLDCLKDLMKSSADLWPKAPDTEPPEDRMTWRTSLCFGDLVKVWSTSSGCWIDGVIAAADEDNVKVVYFTLGRSHLKVLPRASSHLVQTTQPRSFSEGRMGSYEALPCVSPETLAWALGSEEIQVIDLRELCCLEQRIPGALRMPHSTFAGRVLDLVTKFAESQVTLVFCCQDGQQHSFADAELFLDELRRAGTWSCGVCILRGGVEAWSRSSVFESPRPRIGPLQGGRALLPEGCSSD